MYLGCKAVFITLILSIGAAADPAATVTETLDKINFSSAGKMGEVAQDNGCESLYATPYCAYLSESGNGDQMFEQCGYLMLGHDKPEGIPLGVLLDNRPLMDFEAMNWYRPNTLRRESLLTRGVCFLMRSANLGQGMWEKHTRENFEPSVAKKYIEASVCMTARWAGVASECEW